MALQMQFFDLSVESACCHNDWKVRLLGYQKAFEIFLQIDDGNSDKWNRFIDIVKNFITDQNPNCLVKGLLAVLIFVRKCAQAAKTTKDVVRGIAKTCFNSSQSCIFTLAVDIILCYIKIGQQHVVNRELADIIVQQPEDAKVAKICLHLIGEGIKQFGIPTLELGRLISVLAPLLHVGGNDLRMEVRKLFEHLSLRATPEILNSINDVLTSHQVLPMEEINKLVAYTRNALQIKERTDIDAKTGSVSQINYDGRISINPELLLSNEDSDPYTVIEYQDITRTQIIERDICQNGLELEKLHIENTSLVITQSSISPTHEIQLTTKVRQNTIAPYIQNPFNLLEKFKKKFYVKENNFEKWYELDYYVQNILQRLLEENNCSIWIDSLLMYLANRDFPLDVNCTSVKCVTFCAKTLKSDFEPYVDVSLPLLFQKFEVKQRDLISYVRECIDSIFDCTSLEKLQNTVSSIYTKNWNPSVKLEINMFLIRCFSKSRLELTKDCMKTYYSCLTMDLDSKYFHIRRSAVEALGTVMRMVDEKAMEPHLGHVKQFLMTKIKQFAESVVIPNEEYIYPNSCRELGLVNQEMEDSDATEKEYDEADEISLSEFEDEYIDSDPESSSIEDCCCLEYSNLKSIYLDEDEELDEVNGIKTVNNAIASLNEKNYSCMESKTVESNSNEFRITDDIMESRSYWDFSDDDIDDLLLDYPKWEDYIEEDDCEGCTDIEITERIRSRIKPKIRLRSTGNYVRDQLLKNLYRKYNFEFGKIPADAQCPKDGYQKKTELIFSNGLIRNLSDKDLNLRRLSLERIQFLVTSAPGSIDSDSSCLKKAASIIAERISDCSLEISLTAIFLVESLITSMGPPSEEYIKTFFPSLFRAIGDPRPGVQMTALCCIRKWEEICGIERFFLLATAGGAERNVLLSSKGNFGRWLPDITAGLARAWPVFTAKMMKHAWLQCWGSARKMIQNVKTL